MSAETAHKVSAFDWQAKPNGLPTAPEPKGHLGDAPDPLFINGWRTR